MPAAPSWPAIDDRAVQLASCGRARRARAPRRSARAATSSQPPTYIAPERPAARAARRRARGWRGCPWLRSAQGHRPPNRRRRVAYSPMASARASCAEVGPERRARTRARRRRVCQSRKFESRCSPEVRMTRSGSGRSGAARRARSASASMSSGGHAVADELRGRPPRSRRGRRSRRRRRGAGRGLSPVRSSSSSISRSSDARDAVAAADEARCARPGGAGPRTRRWIVSASRSMQVARPRRPAATSSRSRRRRRTALRTPSPGAASTVRRSARVPARWPAITGRPRRARPAAVAVHDDRDGARRRRELGLRSAATDASASG